MFSRNPPLTVVWGGHQMGHELLIFSWFKVGLVVSDKRVCEEEVPVVSDHKVVMTKGVQL